MSIFNTIYDIRDTRYEKGAVLLFTLVVMITLTSVVGAYLGFVQYSTISTGAQISDSRAIYLAEAGLDMAIWYLRNTAPDGSTDCSWRTTAYPADPGSDPNDPQQKSLGNGTFTIWVKDSGSDIQVYARGTVGGLSRVITQTLALTSSALERAIHADGAHLKFDGSTGGIVNGNMSCSTSVLNADDLVNYPEDFDGDGPYTLTQGTEQDKINPSIDYPTYLALAQADDNPPGDVHVADNLTFSSGTYDGVYYAYKGVTIQNGAVIHGSVICEKEINFDNGPITVEIKPELSTRAQADGNNYIALVAGQGGINSSDTGSPGGRRGLQNSTINGLVMCAHSGSTIMFSYIDNTTFNGTIIATNNLELEDADTANGRSFIVNYDADIFSPMPLGFTFSGGDYTVIPQGDWNEI